MFVSWYLRIANWVLHKRDLDGENYCFIFIVKSWEKFRIISYQYSENFVVMQYFEESLKIKKYFCGNLCINSENWLKSFSLHFDNFFQFKIFEEFDQNKQHIFWKIDKNKGLTFRTSFMYISCLLFIGII